MTPRQLPFFFFLLLVLLVLETYAEHTQTAFVAAPWQAHGNAAATSSGTLRLEGGAVSASVRAPAAWELRADYTLTGATTDTSACVALWAATEPFEPTGTGALCGGPARFAGVAAVVRDGTAALLVGDGTHTTPACALPLTSAPAHVRVHIAVAQRGRPATLRVAVNDAPFVECSAKDATATKTGEITTVAASASAGGPAVHLHSLALVPAGAKEGKNKNKNKSTQSPLGERAAALTQRVEAVTAALRAHTDTQTGRNGRTEGTGSTTLETALEALEAKAARAVAAATAHGDAAEGAFRAVERMQGGAARSTGTVRRYAAQERVLEGRRVSAHMVDAHYGTDRGTVALLAVLATAAAAVAALLTAHAHGLTDRLFHEKIY